MSKRVGLPCYECAHKREVPGNAHIQCVASWTPLQIKTAMNVANPHGVKHGWFYFPFLYDPIWARDWQTAESAHDVECEKFTEKPHS